MADASAVGDSEEILLKHVDIMLTANLSTWQDN